jgi:hypothetical protein
VTRKPPQRQLERYDLLDRDMASIEATLADYESDLSGGRIRDRGAQDQ